MDIYRKLHYLAELQNTSVSRIACFCLEQNVTLLENLQWRFLIMEEIKEGRTFPRMSRDCPFFREAKSPL